MILNPGLKVAKRQKGEPADRDIWEGYPGQRGNLRGFRKDANYYVKEEDEKLLKYILEKGMERYDKRKNLWLAMERK